MHVMLKLVYYLSWLLSFQDKLINNYTKRRTRWKLYINLAFAKCEVSQVFHLSKNGFRTNPQNQPFLYQWYQTFSICRNRYRYPRWADSLTKVPNFLKEEEGQHTLDRFVKIPREEKCSFVIQSVTVKALRQTCLVSLSSQVNSLLLERHEKCQFYNSKIRIHCVLWI